MINLKQKTQLTDNLIQELRLSHSNELKGELIKYSKEVGIDAIGFSSVDSFLFLGEELRRREEVGWSSGLAKGTIEERTNPILSMSDAKSFISIAIAYPRKANLPKQDRSNPFAQFSRSS